MSGVLLTAAFLPFSLALGLLAGLLFLELVALVLGGSLLSADTAPELPPDAGQAFDLAPDVEPDVEALLTASAEMDHAPDPAGPGALGILGLGRAPFGIWFAALLTGFGVAGLALQSVLVNAIGAPLPGLVAVLPAAIAGVAFARGTAGVFARLLPQTETSATGAQFMGGLRGVVSQGTARPGIPAEVRLKDRHGNIHYLRCEPVRDEAIAEGTEVLTLRERTASGWGLRIVALPTE